MKKKPLQVLLCTAALSCAVSPLSARAELSVNENNTGNVQSVAENKILILQQPEDQAVKEGAKAVFTVDAQGEGLQYQWQYSTDEEHWIDSGLSGYNTSDLSFVAYKARMNRFYRCKITDKYGNVIYTDAAMLYEENGEAKFEITEEPDDQEVAVDSKVTFHVGATGSGLRYQWQYSADRNKWIDSGLSGSQTADLSFVAYKARMNRWYRCHITDGNGNTLVTKEAGLYEKGAKLEITAQPKEQTVKAGEKVSFAVEATGSGLSYQWQYSTDGNNWIDSTLSGSKTSTLSFIAYEARMNRSYRCVITDTAGNSVISDAAGLYEQDVQLAITAQPQDKNVDIGVKATFTVEAVGAGLQYQWEYSTDGNNWIKSTLSGSTTSTLSFIAYEARMNRWYRCVITDRNGNSVVSDAAILYQAGEKFEITSEPVDQAVTVGSEVSFQVEATGSGIKYQWEYSVDGNNWTKSTLPGSTTSKLSFVAYEARMNRWYRCVLTDMKGNTLTTKAASLRDDTIQFAITEQPQAQEAEEGQEVSFHVGATGSKLTYQWEYSADGTNWIKSSMKGCNTDTLSFTAYKARMNRQYRCVITDITGEVKISDAVMLSEKNESTYTITFKAKGGYFGSEGDTYVIKVTKGDHIGSWWQPSIDEPHTAFENWYYDEECTQVVNNINDIYPNSDMILYAGWGAACSVTLDANGGYFYGIESITEVTDKVLIGHVLTDYRNSLQMLDSTKVFTGWYYDKECTEQVETTDDSFYPTSDVTLYAGWREGYTITYDANGGYFWDEVTITTRIEKVAEGNNITGWWGTPSIEDEHKVFTGWYYDKECTKYAGNTTEICNIYPTNNMTLYAGWTDGYVVTLDANGGYIDYIGRETYTKTVVKGASIGIYYYAGIDDLHKEFNGWYYDKECTNPIGNTIDTFCPTGDVTLYAGWSDCYALTCDANGGYFYSEGNTVNIRKILVGQSVNWLNNPTHNDPTKAFAGWYYDKEFTRPVEQVWNLYLTEDTTIYAKWSEGYTITFNAMVVTSIGKVVAIH